MVVTDASGLGWRGHFSSFQTQGLWSVQHLKCHINVSELCIISLACMAFLLHISGAEFVGTHRKHSSYVLCNQTMGEFIRWKLCQEMILLWNFCISLKAAYLSGVEYALADHLGRSFTSHHKWSLCPDVSVYFPAVGNTPVDLFAARADKNVIFFVPQWTTVFLVEGPGV